MPGPRRHKKPNLPPLVLPDNCTEAWVQDWFELGYRRLCAWLAQRAAFADYCDQHPPPEDELNALD